MKILKVSSLICVLSNEAIFDIEIDMVKGEKNHKIKVVTYNTQKLISKTIYRNVPFLNPAWQHQQVLSHVQHTFDVNYSVAGYENLHPLWHHSEKHYELSVRPKKNIS